MNDLLTDSWGTIAIAILGLVYLVYALAPFNWRFVPNRWAGVIIRLGRVVREVHGEGPIHIWWPFERLVRVPLFDLKVPVPLKDLPTAAPNPQNVTVEIVVVLRFTDPIAVILSVPDREPIDEFKDFVRAAARAGVQRMTIEQISERDAGEELGSFINTRLRQEPVLQRWGLELVSLVVKDINLSKAYIQAQESVIGAEAAARATRIQAEAQAAAANTIGQANPRGVAAILTARQQDAYRDIAKAGGIRTWLQAGTDWLDRFLKDLDL